MNPTQDLKLSLQLFILHSSNLTTLGDASDISLNIADFEDPEVINNEILVLAIKLFREFL